MLFGVPNKDQLVSKNEQKTLFLCAGKDCFKKQRPAFNDLRSSAIDAGLELCMAKKLTKRELQGKKKNKAAKKLGAQLS